MSLCLTRFPNWLVYYENLTYIKIWGILQEGRGFDLEGV